MNNKSELEKMQELMFREHAIKRYIFFSILSSILLLIVRIVDGGFDLSLSSVFKVFVTGIFYAIFIVSTFQIFLATAEQVKLLKSLNKELDEKISNDLMSSINELRRVSITFKSEYCILSSAPKHDNILREFLTNGDYSLSKNRQIFPNVRDDIAYRIDFLLPLIRESRSYCGVRWDTLGGYWKEHQEELRKTTESGEPPKLTLIQRYLTSLKDRPMESKLRLLIVEDSEVEKMAKESYGTDDESIEIRDFYWNNTGEDLRTFWLTRSELEDLLGEKVRYVSQGNWDIYDEEILIWYIPEEDTVYLTVIGLKDTNKYLELNIFEILKDRIDPGMNSEELVRPPFREILRNDGLIADHEQIVDSGGRTATESGLSS